MSLPLGSAVAILVLAVAVAFAAWCLVDVARAGQVRYLPKWVWVVVICVSVPGGGLVYLIFGKARPAASVPWKAAIAEEAGTAASGPLLARRIPVSPVVIEVYQLTKRFGPVTAVDALSFTVRPGHVTGFLGPNGAGKTTTMRVILGLAGRLMTAAQFAAADRAVPSRLVRARDVLAFEWTKLRSVRSNYLTLLIAAMATIGSTAALLAAAFVITRRDA